MKAWQSTFNKALNSVKSNLLFVDCFGLRPRNDGEKKTVIPSVAKESRIKKVNFKNLVLLINEFYKKWIALAFSMPRNDKHISKFEIISHNKNLKSIYYGFLFNKQNFIVRGGIGQ